MLDTSMVTDPASWRDPAGFVFYRDGTLLRQVNRVHADKWDAVVSSGILDRLQRQGWLVHHEPVSIAAAADPNTVHAVIRPDVVPFVSYPYEWAFSQLKDAALLTLDIQAEAIRAGLTLRDASAFNIQFVNGHPVLIDTLSIEPAVQGAPWQAYRQFCEHFLGPLALAAYRDPRCLLMLRAFNDGIPLEVVGRLLPSRTRIRPGLGAHVHLHARAARRRPSEGSSRRPAMGATAHEALIHGLRTLVERLRWDPRTTEWASYEQERTHYEPAALRTKDEVLARIIKTLNPGSAWDLGANTGHFSRIVAECGASVVAWDADPGAVEIHYQRLKTDHQSILPLVTDLMNPSPSLGWANRERRGWLERADVDVVLALALIHHLAVGRNVPLEQIVELLASLARDAVVEWVPPNDPMVLVLAAGRTDVLARYTSDAFEAALRRRFDVAGTYPLTGGRSILHVHRRD